MKMQKKTTVAGAYARKEPYTDKADGKQYDADLKTGDKVKILNAGSVVIGQYGEQKVFSIETRNGPKNLTLNQSSENILIDEFGDDSEAWVGKEANVILKKDVVAGKKVIIAYLVTEGWHLDDFGDLVKEGSINDMHPEASEEEVIDIANL